jgi:hypothetical protein
MYIKIYGTSLGRDYADQITCGGKPCAKNR